MTRLVLEINLIISFLIFQILLPCCFILNFIPFLFHNPFMVLSLSYTQNMVGWQVLLYLYFIMLELQEIYYLPPGFSPGGRL